MAALKPSLGSANFPDALRACSAPGKSVFARIGQRPTCAAETKQLEFRMAKKSFALALAAAAVVLPSSANAAVNIDLSTGGVVRGNVDPDWVITAPGGSVTGGPAFVPTVTNTAWAGAPGSNSGSNAAFNGVGLTAANGVRWITSTANGNANVAAGVYTFKTVFTLPNVALLQNLLLTGRFWADNTVQSVFLNGTPLTLTKTGAGGNGTQEFGNAFDGRFQATSGFQTGTNTLEIMVNNLGPGSNPSALRVQSLATAVPEPGTWMLLVLGFGAIGFSMRFRKKDQARVQFA